MRAMGTLSAQLAESEKAVRTLEHQLETTRLAHGNAQVTIEISICLSFLVLLTWAVMKLTKLVT